MEPVKHCAYNQTSECFLGLDVDAADFSDALFEDRLHLLKPESGGGLWMIPFRGITPGRVRIPLDLVYLDENCRVIEAVESFPLSRVSPSSRPAASVLAVPAHSIRLSHTRTGDQLVLCSTMEMVERLNRMPHSAAKPPHEAGAQGAGLKPEEALHAAGESSRQTGPEARVPSPATGEASSEPVAKKKAKGWLKRLLSPDSASSDPAEARRAPRKTIPGLFAFFWTGATPEPNPIRDISSSGLFIITEERWYPDTVIRMTLTKLSENGCRPEKSISVLAKAVRWGNDGVGLRFVVPDSRGPALEHPDGATRVQLDEFLLYLKDHGYPNRTETTVS